MGSLRADRNVTPGTSVKPDVITNEDPDVIIVDRRSDKTRDLP
jgi:hypothetical protein